MKFFNVVKTSGFTSFKGKAKVFLVIDMWDDFGFKTQFTMIVFDENGTRFNFGQVKIGHFKQEMDDKTFDKIPEKFNALDNEFFSLGQDVSYYSGIRGKLSGELFEKIMTGLNDVAFSGGVTDELSDEDVFRTSITRGISYSVIKGQFKRVSEGGAPLTKYEFKYKKDPNERYSGIDLVFEVKPDSTPPTNMHAVIGRNGIGKTTLLNGMVNSLVSIESDTIENGGFYDLSSLGEILISASADYFTGVISVGFSAFDNSVPPPNRAKNDTGISYTYIGLKNRTDSDEELEKNITVDNIDKPFKALKEHIDLAEEFSNGLAICFSSSAKKSRWGNAISTLESDNNFAQMDLKSLLELNSEKRSSKAVRLFKLMSSGHGAVLLSITRIIENLEEKTLILIDEPESHLHPPLLSAFIRALSDLLIDRNGVAVIATHSPVVLQEMPKSCVWKLRRQHLELEAERPERETFGENVGLLTHDVFGLEVSTSGFLSLLARDVEKGLTYEEILDSYENQLGLEARGLLSTLIFNRNIENKE